MPPATGAGYEIFYKSIKTTPAEKTRMLKILPEILKKVYNEKGITIKEFLPNIPGIKHPEKAYRIIEETLGKDFLIYGSTTTKSLPSKGGIILDRELVTSGFQSRKSGDIDAFAMNLNKKEVSNRLTILTKKLKAIGENVRMSNEHVIEFSPRSKFAGEKFLEAKSGVKGEYLGKADYTMPTGIAGYEFANIRIGEKISKTIPFGKMKAITAGEQTTRKLSGLGGISPGKAAGETISFSESGILGMQKAGGGRGLKDVAGSFQGIGGISFIQQGSRNPLSVRKGVKLQYLMEDLFKTYNKGQQADIKVKLADIIGTGKGNDILLSTSKTAGERAYGFVRGSYKSGYNYAISGKAEYTPSYKAGYKPNYKAMYTPSYKSSYKPGYQQSYVSSYKSSYKPNYKAMYQSSYRPASERPVKSSYIPSYRPDYKAGYSPSYKASYRPSYRPSYQPGYRPGYKPSYRSYPSSPIYRPIERNRQKSPFFEYPKKKAAPSVSKFFVEVKRKGKFYRLSKKPEEFGRALGMGKENVRKTLAASFRITTSEGKPVVLPEMEEFRRSKSRPDVLVQKEGYRLSSRSEVGEIQSFRKASEIFKRSKSTQASRFRFF